MRTYVMVIREHDAGSVEDARAEALAIEQAFVGPAYVTAADNITDLVMGLVEKQDDVQELFDESY